MANNVIMQNGKQPDPCSAPLSGDIVYDGTGNGNCLSDNVFKTDFPPEITSAFACP